jgi:hypothetical protein
MPKPKRSQYTKDLEVLQDNRTILQVALDVHMTTTGSYARSARKQEIDISILEDSIKNWEDCSIPTSAYFDYCVKQLITAWFETQ